LKNSKGLFITAKFWKQPRCPTTDEWVKKIYHIHKMEFYLVVKKYIMLLAGKWIDLENLMLSKLIQTENVKGHMFALICGS
jgi:hypothetical protein